MIWLFWCLIAFFFLSRKQQRSNQSNQKHVHCVCHRKKVVQLKDVHGVAFTVIWIIAAIRQNCRTLLVSIMMLIAGALGLCKGAHKNYGYYIFALLHIKRILKKKTSYMTAVFLPLCTFHFCFATRFQNHDLSVLCFEGDLKRTPLFHIQCWSRRHPRPGSGLACVLLTPDARVDPTQPEREGDLPQQGRGVGGMSGWVNGWSGVRVTLLPH